MTVRRWVTALFWVGAGGGCARSRIVKQEDPANKGEKRRSCHAEAGVQRLPLLLHRALGQLPCWYAVGGRRVGVTAVPGVASVGSDRPVLGGVGGIGAGWGAVHDARIMHC